MTWPRSRFLSAVTGCYTTFIVGIRRRFPGQEESLIDIL
jgi:hypothetical protein